MPNAQPIVNSFNGLSDDSAAAARAQSLWDAGAFNPDGKPDPAQGQKGTPEPQAAAPPAEPVAPNATEPPAVQAEVEAPGPEYSNLEEYLQSAGLERDSFFSLPTRVKVDGKEREVTLADLAKSYGLEQHLQAKSVAFADQQRAWEAEATQKRQALEQHLQSAAALAQVAQQQLLADYGKIQPHEWQQLRAEKPGEYAALVADFNARQTAIQNHLMQVQQRAQQLQAEQQQQLAKQLPIERDRMLEQHPEWRDNTKFQAAREEIHSYAQHEGYTDAELSAVIDHRYMSTLWKAAQYDKLQAASPKALAQVRAAPKAPAPGARTTRDPKVANLQSARESFMKSRRDPDAAARYAQTLVDAGA